MTKATAYTSILKRTAEDKRITATHLGLLSALFICWQASGFNNPFSVNRKTLMGFSRIASTATYHKYIKQLDKFGYISYRPSYHPVKGSSIEWLVVYNEPAALKMLKAKSFAGNSIK